MPDARIAPLAGRGLLGVSGADRVRFLQGLVSNDVEKVTPTNAVYAAFLTPQGKYLFDFVMLADGGRLLLDCEAGRLADFARRLSLYRLRSKVEVADASADWRLYAVFGETALAALDLEGAPGATIPYCGGFAMIDPRHSGLGARLVLPPTVDPDGLGLSPATPDDYDTHRIGLGIPDGSRDLVVEKTILLEAGFDELNGVDWQKGCYMGQELTARTKYRGLVKRRLLPVEIDGVLPQAGTPVTLDGRDAGEIRSGRGNRAIAMIRLAMLDDGDGAIMQAGTARVTPRKPEWAAF